ncbi:hypothetical protein MCOR25_001018 [Pyricularia grisea]|nr:hypothetical protein MCOR25_001018 [Pyricularia grisea]
MWQLLLAPVVTILSIVGVRVAFWSDINLISSLTTTLFPLDENNVVIQFEKGLQAGQAAGFRSSVTGFLTESTALYIIPRAATESSSKRFSYWAARISSSWSWCSAV